MASVSYFIPDTKIDNTLKTAIKQLYSKLISAITTFPVRTTEEVQYSHLFPGVITLETCEYWNCRQHQVTQNLYIHKIIKAEMRWVSLFHSFILSWHFELFAISKILRLNLVISVYYFPSPWVMIFYIFTWRQHFSALPQHSLITTPLLLCFQVITK